MSERYQGRQGAPREEERRRGGQRVSSRAVIMQCLKDYERKIALILKWAAKEPFTYRNVIIQVTFFRDRWQLWGDYNLRTSLKARRLVRWSLQ